MPQEYDAKIAKQEKKAAEDIKVEQAFIQKGVDGLVDLFIEDFMIRNPNYSPENIKVLRHDMKLQYEEADKKIQALLAANNRLKLLYGKEFADRMTEKSKFHKVTSNEIISLFDEMLTLHQSDKLNQSIIEQKINNLIENCARQIKERELHEMIMARQAAEKLAETKTIEAEKYKAEVEKQKMEYQELKRKLAELETQKTSDAPSIKSFKLS